MVNDTTTIVDRLRAAIHLESAAIAPRTSPLIEAAREAADALAHRAVVIDTLAWPPSALALIEKQRVEIVRLQSMHADMCRVAGDLAEAFERGKIVGETVGWYAAKGDKSQSSPVQAGGVVDIHQALTAADLEYSAMSWSGFNLFGDRASIDEAKRMQHAAGTVPALRDRIKELMGAQTSGSGTEGER